MRSTGRKPQDREPQKAAPSGAGDEAVSGETMRRLGEAAGVSVWTWHVADDVVHPMGGSARAKAPLDGMLERIEPTDRTRVRRRLRAAARSGNSGTMQLHSAPAT